MSEFIKKLTAIMFYASLPLLIPFFYSLYVGDGTFVSIGLTILLLALPALPTVVGELAHNLETFIHSLFQKEIPWNYAEIIHIRNLEKRVETVTLGETLVLTSVAWLIIPLVASLPYIMHGVPMVDALFESLSGWTSTGLSALPSVEGFPRSLLLFRSVTQWIGGLGIVILMLTVLRGREATKFLKAEGHLSSEVGIGQTVAMIWKIYLFLTLFGVLLLILLGLGPFYSVNLTMSGISSGGFFPFDSYAFSDAQKLALTLLMFMGATGFLIYKYLAQGRVRRALLDEEFLLYIGITLLAFLSIITIGHEDISNTFLNTVSAITSAGFVIGDVSLLHDFGRYLLILLMLSGGMLGSTTGGLKLWRILLVLKSILRRIRAAFLPRGTVQVIKINDSPVEDSTVEESFIFVFAYMMLLLIAAGVFIAFDYRMVDAFFLVASAQGNVGLSPFTLTGMGDVAKLFLMVLMYLGRIEIFPSLALLRFLGGGVKK